MVNKLAGIKILNLLSWILVFVSLAYALVEGLTLGNNIDLVVLICMIFAGWAFSIINGIIRYGWKDMLIFFLISAVISNFYENLSIATGFPFGFYHYSDLFGPKFIEAPYFLAIGYIFVVYVGWQTAHIVLQKFTNKLSGYDVLLIPILTSLFAVMTDLSFDPFFSTVQGRYIWHTGGAYYGVPFVNYLGWYLCIYTIAQVYSIYMWHKNKKNSIVNPPELSSRSFWLQSILASFIWPIMLILKGFTVDQNATAKSLDGITWNVSYLLQTGGLISIGTILSVGILAIIIIASTETDMKNKFRLSGSQKAVGDINIHI